MNEEKIKDELLNWVGYLDSLMKNDETTSIDVSRIVALNNTSYALKKLENKNYFIHFPEDIKFDIENKSNDDLISYVNVYDESNEDIFLNWSLIYTELIDEKKSRETLNKYKKYFIEVACANIEDLFKKLPEKNKESTISKIPSYILEIMEDCYGRKQRS